MSRSDSWLEDNGEQEKRRRTLEKLTESNTQPISNLVEERLHRKITKLLGAMFADLKKRNCIPSMDDAETVLALVEPVIRAKVEASHQDCVEALKGCVDWGFIEWPLSTDQIEALRKAKEALNKLRSE